MNKKPGTQCVPGFFNLLHSIYRFAEYIGVCKKRGICKCFIVELARLQILFARNNRHHIAWNWHYFPAAENISARRAGYFQDMTVTAP